MLRGCCKKCNNLFFLQFSIFQHILYMSGYGRFVALKQFRHLVSRKPNSIVFEYHLYAGVSIGRLI